MSELAPINDINLKIFEEKRGDIAVESKSVSDFSDECVFWVCEKHSDFLVKLVLFALFVHIHFALKIMSQ